MLSSEASRGFKSYELLIRVLCADHDNVHHEGQ